MKSRIVFLTREPVLHQMSGSTTSALNLLGLLAGQGARITIVCTSAFSRSPRLWFKRIARIPEGVDFFAPGYVRIGAWYVDPLSFKGWARAIGRLAARHSWLDPLKRLVQSLYDEDLYTNAWDLTTPTEDEREVALAAIERRNATTVLVNYAFWAPLFDESRLSGRKRVILMHDLLSARVSRFLSAGTPLDCPLIDEPTELAWLNRADTVLAAQRSEAEEIRTKVRATVLVQPILFETHPSAGAPEPGRCLFVGGNILPNRTGLEWFLREVWPRVIAARPDARLIVAGSVSTAVEAKAPAVTALGVVPSLASEYAQASVCVVPLLIGSGIKIKLLEALSYGKATVATSVGVQGLEDWAEGVVDVADDPVRFCAAIVQLLNQDELRQARERAAVQLMEQHFSLQSALSPEFLHALF